MFTSVGEDIIELFVGIIVSVFVNTPRHMVNKKWSKHMVSIAFFQKLLVQNKFQRISKLIQTTIRKCKKELEFIPVSWLARVSSSVLLP